MKLCRQTRDELIELANEKNIYLEGTILKIVEPDEGDDDFAKYITTATEKEKEKLRKRLEVTKQIQIQNTELIKTNEEKSKLMGDLRDSLDEAEQNKVKIEAQNAELIVWKEENQRISDELKEALQEAQDSKHKAIKAKEAAESDLDLMQKKTQFELINAIVRAALWIVVGIGVVTTILYGVSLAMGKDTSVIGPAWSNLFSILLTNAFSIIGTIMGVKYASKH